MREEYRILYYGDVEAKILCTTILLLGFTLLPVDSLVILTKRTKIAAS